MQGQSARSPMGTITRQRILGGLWLVLVSALARNPANGYTEGLPEPGLVMYGTVLNTSTGQSRLISGTLTWTIFPPTGLPITVSTPLTDINGEYSFAVIVPFETVIGNSTISANTLQLSNSSSSYIRTNITFSLNGTNYPAIISAPALGTFTFGPFDRGRMEQVNLTVSVSGLSVSNSNPAFATPPRIVNGQLQLAVSGTVGQNYTLFGSTDLVTWAAISMFTCTNNPTPLYDPSTSAFTHRFYKLGP